MWALWQADFHNLLTALRLNARIRRHRRRKPIPRRRPADMPGAYAVDERLQFDVVGADKAVLVSWVLG